MYFMQIFIITTVILITNKYVHTWIYLYFLEFNQACRVLQAALAKQCVKSSNTKHKFHEAYLYKKYTILANYLLN